jgi:hypothetical protein
LTSPPVPSKKCSRQTALLSTKILGQVDEEKTARAERKRDYMNWQLTEQIEEFRDEQEQLLTQLPLGGSQYMKLWYDEQKKRPCAEFLPIDRVIVPFCGHQLLHRPACDRGPRHHRVGVQAPHRALACTATST